MPLPHDSATTSTDAFAGLTLDCEHVQSKVSAKYDSWQKEVVGKFASILDTAMRETHSNVRNARLALEHQPPLDGCKTAEAVVLITLIQDLKQKQAMWTTTITALQSGQKELERNRYQFPAEWLHVESLTGEWSAFSSIYHKKDFVIQQQMGMGAGLK